MPRAAAARARLAATAARSSLEPRPQLRLALMPPEIPPLRVKKACRTGASAASDVAVSKVGLLRQTRSAPDGEVFQPCLSNRRGGLGHEGGQAEALRTDRHDLEKAAHAGLAGEALKRGADP